MVLIGYEIKMDIRKLLEIEEDSKILDFKFEVLDIPMWLPIRFQVYQDIINHYAKLDNPHIRVNLFKMPFKKKLDYFIKTLKKHPFRDRKVDILIFGAGINNVLEGGKYYNRLYDHLFKILDGLLLIESSSKFSYPTPRHLNEIYYEDIIGIFSSLYSKFCNTSLKDRQNIQNFISYISNRLQFLGYKDVIDTTNYLYILEKMSKKIKLRSKLYNKLLKTLKPKAIIVEDAHYFERIDLITIAKRSDIRVVEYQHGLINENHLAYNFSEGIVNKVKDYSPDEMLFWGEYWAERAKIPGIKVIVGFPYIEIKSKYYKQKNKSKSLKRILLCSSGTIPEKYIEFGEKILKTLGKEKYEYVFRPHPSERPSVYDRYSALLNIGYQLDNYNLYESLSNADFVISLEPTTVLYEAVKFCDTVINLILTSSSSLYFSNEILPFLTANTVEECLEYITKENLSVNRDFIDSIFYPKYEEAWQYWRSSI